MSSSRAGSYLPDTTRTGSSGGSSGGKGGQDASGGQAGAVVPGSVTPASFDVSQFGKSLGASMQNAFEDGNQVFNKPLYTGMGAQTNAGLNSLYNTAAGSQGMFDAGTGYTQGLLNSGGLTGNMRGAINGTGAVAGNYDSLYRGAGAPSLTEQNMMNVANGGMLRGGNPYFEANLAKAKDNTYSDVMASLGASGRTGSSVHMDELTGALGNLENGARGAQYETERDRQMQALSSIEAQRQQSFGNQNAALQGRLGALGQQFGMEQQGIGNAMGATAALPGLYEASLMPGQTMLQAGQVRDADAQAQRMADYDLFNRRDPYSHLAKYAGLLNGSQQTAGIQQETPWWQTALGTAATVAGAFL